MTDFQRERVYTAERSVRDLFANAYDRPSLVIHGSTITIPEARKFGSLAGVQTFVERVQAMPWYVARFPNCTPIKVRNRRASNRAHYQGGTIAVAERTHRLDQWAMHEPYILHEMAHHTAAGDGHGPTFAAHLLLHLGNVMGPEARLLTEDAMHAAGVKIDYSQLV